MLSVEKPYMNLKLFILSGYANMSMVLSDSRISQLRETQLPLLQVYVGLQYFYHKKDNIIKLISLIVHIGQKFIKPACKTS